MLTYLDLELLFKNRNVPGRFRIVDFYSKSFLSATVTEAAGVITLPMPRPAVGFCRLWLALHAVISTAVATDIVLLRWGDDVTRTVLMRLFPNNIAVLLIGGGSGQNVAAGPTYKTIDPLLVSDVDIMEVVYQVVALSGQTATLTGRYMDLPC